MTPEQRQEIYEWGELEREFEHMAQFTKHGGLMARFFLWCAKQCKEQREIIKEEASKS